MNAIIRKQDWRTYQVIVLDAHDRIVSSTRVTRDTSGRWCVESHPNLVFATRREAASFLCSQGAY